MITQARRWWSMRKALLSAALAVVLAGLGSVALPTAAEAQSGYRVCGVYNSASDSRSIGTGLVAKIWKGDNTYTCLRKVRWMQRFYGTAWKGSSGLATYYMMDCELFAVKTGTPGDPCDNMAVNKIYRNYSVYDYAYPVNEGSVAYFHD
jgi:hypothetical protein